MDTEGWIGEPLTREIQREREGRRWREVLTERRRQMSLRRRGSREHDAVDHHQ
jgi:hypothetical protein